MTTVAPAPVDHVVPVATPRPVGRVEWIDTPVRLYGVDSIGQVFGFPHPLRTPARESAFRRLAVALTRARLR